MITPTDTKQGRYYPWDGNKFISVTTAIGDGVPKPGLNRWFIKNLAELAAKNRKALAKIGRAPDAKEWLLDKHYGDKDNSAAILGSAVHALCEKIANGEGVENNSETEPFIAGYRAFIKKYSVKFIETEATVFSKEHGYAGTLDAIIEVDGKLYVADIKTGKSVYPEVALQCAAYRYAEFIGRSDKTEDQMPKVKGGLVLHVRPEGTSVFPLDIALDTFDTFLSALDIYRWQKIDGKHAIGDMWE